MSKQRKRKPATLRLDADRMAKHMTTVAAMMWTVAKRMEDFNGLNPNMKGRAMRLASQGMMLDNWADEVRAQANKKVPKV
jgi:hypothetical protein